MVFNRKKLNISLVYISQPYFKMPKTIKLNVLHCFLIEIPNKKELQQIAWNNSFGIDFKDVIKSYKDYTEESYSVLVSDTFLSSENLLQFMKNLL